MCLYVAQISGERLQDHWSHGLKIWEIFASFQMSGSFPVSKDFWKISCRIGANSLCKVCRTMGLNLSGPAAYKQLVNAFFSYAYIRHFGVGTGLEWWADTRVMQIL